MKTASRKPVKDNDFFNTPRILTEKLVELEKFKNIDEVACGNNSIVDVLEDYGYIVNATDLDTGHDFLKATDLRRKNHLITNPPFYLWDKFVLKAKELQYKKFAFIGKLNYYGSNSRYENKIFQGLKTIYAFDRQIDYQCPKRIDNLYHVGALITGWFIWERNYKGPAEIKHVTIQDGAKLGAFDSKKYKILKDLGIHDSWNPDQKLDLKEIQKLYNVKMPVDIVENKNITINRQLKELLKELEL